MADWTQLPKYDINPHDAQTTKQSPTDPDFSRTRDGEINIPEPTINKKPNIF